MVVGVAQRVQQHRVHFVACDEHTCRSCPCHGICERDSQRFECTCAESESQFVFANYPQVGYKKCGVVSSWERYARLCFAQIELRQNRPEINRLRLLKLTGSFRSKHLIIDIQYEYRLYLPLIVR